MWTPRRAERISAELEFTWWQRSTVVNRDRSGKIVSFHSRTRSSWSAQEEYFPAELVELLGEIELRVCASFGLRGPCFEPWQAIRYDLGGHFDLHHDGGLFGEDVGGERRTTVLLYLETPDAGGEIEFPDLGRTVAAHAGRLMLWRNLTADGDIEPAAAPPRAPGTRRPQGGAHDVGATALHQPDSQTATKGAHKCPMRTTSSPLCASATGR